MTTETHRILLIEDDTEYSDMLLERLGREGFATLSASTGSAGLILAESRQPSLILLDMKLPDTDGIHIHNALRHNPKTSVIPIIMITGMDMLPNVLDVVAAGLRTEPAFCKDEGTEALLQRIRRTIHSSGQDLLLTLNPHGQVLRKGHLIVDLKTRQFMFGNKSFPQLAPQRFFLLCALMRSDGPVSREKLLLDIWDETRDPKVVDVTIARLRRDFKNLRHVTIQTTRHGYALIVSPPH
ncbi:MAG: response regulator transcription factor [Elusimicrobiota bacterium]|nr:response regulator transcription factor [Elusimicrobiota bacterium]